MAKGKRRVLALVLVFVLCMGALPALASAKTVVIGTPNEFGTLEPYGQASAGKKVWEDIIYEPLCIRDGFGGPLVGVMASDIEEIDGFTYRVTIYDYVYDSQGNHITASDVAYSYTKCKELGIVTKMYYLDSATMVDDYTVEFKLTADGVGVIEDMLSKIYIVSEKAFEESGDALATYCVGSGPYEMVEFLSGSSITLKRREDYWQTDASLIPDARKANVETLIYKYIGEAAQLSIALESGTIDIINGLTGSQVSNFVDENNEALDKYTVTAELNSLINVMFFNMSEDSVFAGNQALRQSVLYAIDTTAIVAGVLNNRGEVCYAFASAIYGDFQQEWLQNDYYWYDLTQAQTLFDESGFVQQDPIIIMSDSNADRKKQAEIIQAYLLQLGLRCEIVTYDTALYNEYKNKTTEWDIRLDNVKSPDLCPNIWSHVFSADNNNGTTVNFATDEYLQELVALVGSPEGHTVENLNLVNDYLNEQAIAYATYDAYQFFIAQDGVTDLFIDANGYMFAWASTYADDFAGAQ